MADNKREPREITKPYRKRSPSPPKTSEVYDYDQVSHTAHDKTTGEHMDIYAKPAKQTHYDFGGEGHRVFGVRPILQLLNYNLSSREKDVVLWLLAMVERNNILEVSGRDAEQGLNMERHLFSRIISKIVSLGIIRRRHHERKGTFTLNPHFAWNGSAVEQHIAIQKWDGADQVVAISSRKEA